MTRNPNPKTAAATRARLAGRAAAAASRAAAAADHQPQSPLLPTDDLVIGQLYVVKRQNGKVEEKFIASLIEIKEVCKRDIKKNRQEKMERDQKQEDKQEEEPPPKKPCYDGEQPCTSADTQKEHPDLLRKASDAQSDSSQNKEDGNNTSGVVARQERTTISPEGSDKSSKDDDDPGRYKLFYIHYEGLDRRLDEWVERDRFVERTVPAALCSPAILPPGVENASVPSQSGALTRSQKRIHVEFHHQQTSYDDMDATTAKLEKEHEERTKVKNIELVVLGSFEISTWYFSPYPFRLDPQERLYICEFCLLYVRKMQQYALHKKHCKLRTPPGVKIYRKDNLAVYELEGKANKVYCQCLCLLSKLFLDHKTLYFDVDTFIFYILCEVDHLGAHIVGHFSKELQSENNLACIMVLPPFQRKGYGKLLIQLSYELSAREGWIGTPEKPLSDMGKVSYRSYWRWRLISVMEQQGLGNITVSELSRISGVVPDDIVSTLQTMGMVKYWKGDHVVRTNRRVIEHCIAQNFCRPPRLLLDRAALRWTPQEVRGPPRTNIEV